METVVYIVIVMLIFSLWNAEKRIDKMEETISDLKSDIRKLNKLEYRVNNIEGYFN